MRVSDWVEAGLRSGVCRAVERISTRQPRSDPALLAPVLIEGHSSRAVPGARDATQLDLRGAAQVLAHVPRLCVAYSRIRRSASICLWVLVAVLKNDGLRLHRSRTSLTLCCLHLANLSVALQLRSAPSSRRRAISRLFCENIEQSCV